jgi:hypothetical protein
VATRLAPRRTSFRTEAGDTFVTFQAPDEDKMLEGEGDNTVTRVVIYDNKAKRGSGVTAETVLTLKAGKKPLNLPIILGGAGIVVVILLLVVVLLRGGGGGGKGKRANQPPPAPVVAGGQPPYGAPPYGGGSPPYGGGGGNPPPYGGGGGGYQPPPGGGYGASAQQNYQAQAYAPNANAFVPAAPPPTPPVSPEPSGGGGYPFASAGGAPVEVRCPACKLTTLAMPGQASVCFSCGQPLPKDVVTAAIAVPPSPRVAEPALAVAAAPAFPLTSAHRPEELAPPPNPYGTLPTSATIVGAAGQFAIRGGVEVRVGRDPAACPITLAEPRVSGVHATLKFEGGQLMVRDEGSNNGTYLAGARIAPHQWMAATAGSSLRFGPVEFAVKID